MDRTGIGAALGAELSARGQASVRVFAGERTERIEPGCTASMRPDPGGYRAVLEEAFSAEQPCRGVVHLWGLDATSPAATTVETLASDQREGSLSALYLAQRCCSRAIGTRRGCGW
jgi:hypothetical protein